MTRWCEKYIGVPFVDRGRDLAGWDCWGLVRYVLFAEKQIKLPSYADISSENGHVIEEAYKTESESSLWLSILLDQIREFDVVVMRTCFRAEGELRQADMHVGLVVGSQHILHVEPGRDTALMHRNHSLINRRLTAAYRRHELS